MADYFAGRGGNRADARAVLGEPVRLGLVKVRGRRFDALRTDALGAEPAEAVRAQEYADDLASAVGAQDSDRTERVLARINTLLSTASAAFALTRSLLSPGP